MSSDMKDVCYRRKESGKKWPTNFACDSNFHVNPGIFNMSQIYDMGQTALLSFQRRHAEDFFARKNLTASVGFEAANSGTRGQHANY
jgi:hypothetical protein